jgi:hypothetical protein
MILEILIALGILLLIILLIHILDYYYLKICIKVGTIDSCDECEERKKGYK